MTAGHMESERAGGDRQSVALCVAIGLCHAPMAALQLRKFWYLEAYWYTPLLLVAIAYLLVQRWRQLPVRPACGPTRAALATLAISLVLLAGAVALASPWLGLAAAIVTLLAVLLSFGWPVARRLVPVWLLLWLVLPLPFRWDQRLILWLQGYAAEGGSLLLDAWGWNHVLAGYVLEVPGQQFPVEQLAHGLQALFAVLATAAVLAVWQCRSLVAGLLLVCTAPFWTVAWNMAGAALTVVLASGGTDVTAGLAGGLFALTLFLCQVLSLLSTDRLLQFLLASPGVAPMVDEEGNLVGAPLESAVPAELPQAAAVAATVSRPRRLAFQLLTAGFLAVAVFQGTAWFAEIPRGRLAWAAASPTASGVRGPRTDALNAASLPRLLSGWSAVDFRVATATADNEWGHSSIAWHYADARDEVVVSLDYPVAQWQDPADSFDVRGWEIETRQESSDEASGGQGLEVRMRDASGRRGYLLVRRFTDAGRVIAPPARNGWSLAARCQSAIERVLTRLGETGNEPRVYQVQLLVIGDLPLNDQQQIEARRAFEHAASRIAICLWPAVKDEE